CQHGDGAPYSF
nr:immunoglobulin light chain junction region [Macaca mulatta]